MAGPSHIGMGKLPTPSKDASILASTVVDQVNKDDIMAMVYVQRDMYVSFYFLLSQNLNFYYHHCPHDDYHYHKYHHHCLHWYKMDE